MANTDGGTTVLGIAEATGGFVIEGLKNPDQMLKTCWDTAHNRGKVSARRTKSGECWPTSRRNRQIAGSCEQGLTVAGLLMFGDEDALNDTASGLKFHIDRSTQG
ncbi:MAG: hypothetical protein ACKOEO_21575 [Planctomycetaceae bacterium]